MAEFINPNRSFEDLVYSFQFSSLSGPKSLRIIAKVMKTIYSSKKEGKDTF